MAEPGKSSRKYRFGVYEANVASGELSKNGSKLRLQEQPFQVLLALLERPGEVVTREELRQRLWPADTFVDFDHSLNTAINKLRDALGDTAANPRFIETLARRGYRFIAPVQGESAEAPLLAPSQAAVPVETAPTPAHAKEMAPVLKEELPQPGHGLVRVLFLLIQLMYLTFYIIALAQLDRVYEIAALSAGAGSVVVTVAVISAVIGIPIRLYLVTATAFDYRRLGEKFARLFPLLFVVDEIWALSPLLISHKIGGGLALAACAALLYIPFSQRTLMRMGYPVAGRQASLGSE